MYLTEVSNITDVSSLNNTEIIDNLLYMERKYEFLYCRELRKLEKIKAELIIRNLDEFQEAQKKYHYLKSMTPEVWFENWEVYKNVLDEAKKRNLEIPHQNHVSEKMLCFG